MANALTMMPQGATDPGMMPPDAQTLQAPAPEFKGDLALYRRWFNAYETNKRDELEEQQIAEKYYHGKQWTAEQIKKLKKRGQAPIFDNRIGRKIDFLVGVEQRMRRDPKGYPRNPDDEHSADIATACERFVCDVNRWPVVASDVINQGLIRGIGVCFVGIEPGRDGNDPVIKAVQTDRFFYDPRSMLPDFSDARYMGLHLWLDIDEAKERWPDMSDQLDQLIDRSNSSTSLILSDQDHSKAWADFEGRRIRIVEFWQRTAKGWTFCNFTSETQLDGGISPYVDEAGKPDCPYVAWSPYIDERGDRYGVIRNMKPMQDEINHRRSKFLHLLSTKQLHIRRGTIDDIDEMRKQLARPDGIIEHDGDWGTTTGIVDHTQDIQGQSELLAQSQASLENLGPNPGLIGKGGGVADQSGRAILAQRDSGMTELSPVFERNRDWKLRVYRKVWSRIKQAWDAPKYIRVTDDEEAPKFLGINQYGQHPQTGQLMSQNVLADIDIDIIMEEGPNAITMNEELMQTLSQIGANPAVPPKVLIELSNAPNKDRLFKLIDEAGAQNPEVMAMQQRMAKLEELLAAAKVDDLVAATELKRAQTVSALATSFTPAATPTNEFGQQTGPTPQAPDFGQAMNVMSAFPLHYGQPTLEQLSLMQPNQQQQPDEQDPNGQQMMPQGGQQMMQPGMQGMPPPDQQMPGGLPVNPAFAGMQ